MAEKSEEEEGELSDSSEYEEKSADSILSVSYDDKVNNSIVRTSGKRKEEEVEEKSEGELSDSEDEEPDLPPSKRVRETTAEEDGKELHQLTEHRFKYQETKKRKRRKKSKLSKLTARLDKAYSEGDEAIDHYTLLAQLKALCFSSSSGDENDPFDSDPRGSLLQYKTHMLQTTVVQLVERKVTTSLLDPQHVVVVWLSMISANLFLDNPNLFTSLSSLSPSLSFLLHHPGTETFAKLGLESFLFKPDSPRNKKKKKEGEEKEVEGTVKQKCILNLKGLRKNLFPLPKQLQKKDAVVMDTTDYLSFYEDGVWPKLQYDDRVNKYPMYAVDCEMVETEQGQELVRVSVVDENLVCLYDTLVQPPNPILDYKTRYSGVTEDMLRDVSTSLSDVHQTLLNILPPHCILIGQSLENDFYALKMMHPFVIDTSYLFTHTYKFKPKLRFLAKKLLSLDIQTGSSGHSSVQDAQTCMQLVLKKLELGEHMTIQQKEQNILTELADHGHPIAMIDRSGVVSLFGDKTNQCVVRGDEEVLATARLIIPQHRLSFIQLHGYEDFLRSSSSTSAAEHDRERVLRQLDSEAGDIITSCPPETLVLVVCGSSNIRDLKSLQRRKETEKIKELVDEARTGLGIAFIT